MYRDALDAFTHCSVHYLESSSYFYELNRASRDLRLTYVPLLLIHINHLFTNRADTKGSRCIQIPHLESRKNAPKTTHEYINNSE